MFACCTVILPDCGEQVFGLSKELSLPENAKEKFTLLPKGEQGEKDESS